MRYPTLAARLEANSVPTSCGCRIWIGRVNNSGYPVFTQRVEGKDHPVPKYAHRASVECSTGEAVPDDMHVDHICVTTRCIAPDHLQVVTPQENQALRIARRRAQRSSSRH